MRIEHHRVPAPALGGAGEVIVYGHWGRPVLVFPSQEGQAGDYAERGMVDAVAGVIEAGRAKLYCVDSFDRHSWFDDGVPLEERARRHGLYEDWILSEVVRGIYGDCGGYQEILVTGCSFGAYHAANFALRRADLFPVAICQSGVYDIGHLGWGQRGDAVYFNNPSDYIANAGGDHLDWLRSRVHLVLVCGQGMWEDTTGALEATKRFGSLLAGKGIPHETDLWGHDVIHDWPSWRDQFAHHLPRFC